MCRILCWLFIKKKSRCVRHVACLNGLKGNSNRKHDYRTSHAVKRNVYPSDVTDNDHGWLFTNKSQSLLVSPGLWTYDQPLVLPSCRTYKKIVPSYGQSYSCFFNVIWIMCGPGDKLPELIDYMMNKKNRHFRDYWHEEEREQHKRNRKGLYPDMEWCRRTRKS